MNYCFTEYQWEIDISTRWTCGRNFEVIPVGGYSWRQLLGFCDLVLKLLWGVALDEDELSAFCDGKSRPASRGTKEKLRRQSKEWTGWRRKSYCVVLTAGSFQAFRNRQRCMTSWSKVRRFWREMLSAPQCKFSSTDMPSVCPRDGRGYGMNCLLWRLNG